jgi:hypothetical protein
MLGRGGTAGPGRLGGPATPKIRLPAHRDGHGPGRATGAGPAVRAPAPLEPAQPRPSLPKPDPPRPSPPELARHCHRNWSRSGPAAAVATGAGPAAAVATGAGPGTAVAAGAGPPRPSPPARRDRRHRPATTVATGPPRPSPPAARRDRHHAVTIMMDPGRLDSDSAHARACRELDSDAGRLRPLKFAR